MSLTPLRRSSYKLNYSTLIAILISLLPVLTKSSFNNRLATRNSSKREWTSRLLEIPYPRAHHHNSNRMLNPPVNSAPIPDQNWWSISPKQELVDMESLKPEEEPVEEPMKRRRIPGFPRDPPLPSVNITNVITLVELAANDAEIDDEIEALLIQTLKEVMTAIGLQDTGDLLGMFMMYFVMGPVLIPLLWMPYAMVALGLLTIPIIYSRPLMVGAGRQNSNNNFQSSECLEMLSCEFTNFLRNNWWSSWISRIFKFTKVEWAAASAKKSNKKSRRGSGWRGEFSEQEDCAKYSCILMKPAQRFFGSWYSYIFTYQQPFDNI